MQPEQLARVRFLVREDAWAAWEASSPPADALDMALSEYSDLRLVAVYVLEAVCSAARQSAALTSAGQTKSYEVVGEWREEYFAPVAVPQTVSADDWCRRAAELRAQVLSEARRVGSRSVSLPVEVVH